jgi:hypothetical protein
MKHGKLRIAWSVRGRAHARPLRIPASPPPDAHTGGPVSNTSLLSFCNCRDLKAPRLESSIMLSADEHAVLVDDWLRTSEDRNNASTPGTTVDDVHRLAAALDPDEQMQLVVRLWNTLPADQRATLIALQPENLQGSQADFHGVSSEPRPPGLLDKLFNFGQGSDLYCAPRRFDLATIFVVTAAYSILLGGLTTADAPAGVKVVICVLVTFIAGAQALFISTANPRGVSIMTGAVGWTLISWYAWLSWPKVFPNSFFFVTFIMGVGGGAIMGYLLGALVGGVFLVADALRGRFDGRGRKGFEEN